MAVREAKLMRKGVLTSLVPAKVERLLGWQCAWALSVACCLEGLLGRALCSCMLHAALASKVSCYARGMGMGWGVGCVRLLD